MWGTHCIFNIWKIIIAWEKEGGGKLRKIEETPWTSTMKGVIGCLAYWFKKKKNRIRVDHGEIVDTRNERLWKLAGMENIKSITNQH